MDKQRTLPLWAILLLLLSTTSASLVTAGPVGGQVVGGSGSISQSGLNTTINQTSQNMAIDWQSYNLNANERVQYLQPDSSSISLNRILSQNGSTIAGRIDANGQVILVNPNGIFFTPTSIINVGGIIASGLNIQSTDFMNGNYIFDDVLGTDGTVINSGIINASLGGNVALIGKQVKNDGLITANLGTVSLAAGKQAVLTFDQGGLLGVRISEKILQEELGVDPAVLNSGEINALGGRVLLTASTSQDVFSQAVNTGSLSQAISVVLHEDGSFTLGDGADVLNHGNIDTSTAGNTQNVGRIVLIGENVTSSGGLYANATRGNGGEIELHAQNTVLLTENSLTSARSETDGQGGIIKVLGNRVGLFGQSRVDVSGANGGGQALIGGDYLGGNANIRNATTTVVGQETVLAADALQQGDGGRVILWADQNTYFWGDITVRGGALSGNGGFVETSGKENLLFDGNVDLSANNGDNGLLLLDPRDITIVSGDADQNIENNNELREFDDLDVFFDDGGNASFNITAERIESVLASGNVQLAARRDITIDENINANLNSSSLTLLAGDDITINSNINIGSGNLLMVAGSASCQTSCALNDGVGGGVGFSRNIYINGQLDTTGNIDLYASDHVILDQGIGDTLQPSSVTIRAGDSILVNAINNGNSIEPNGSSNEGRITSSGVISLTASDTELQTDEITINTTSGPVTTAITVFPTNTAVVGSITIEGNVTTDNGDFTAITTTGYFNNLFNTQNLNTGMGAVTIQTGGTGTLDVDGSSVTAGAFLGYVTANTLSVSTMGSIIQSTTAESQNLVITGEASFNAGSNPINLLNSSNNLQGTISLITTGSNDVILNNGAAITILGTTEKGALNVGGMLTVNAEQRLTLVNNITVVNTAQLNFAQDGNDGHIFTTSLGLDFTANTTVAGGDGNDIFNITSSMAGPINGNDGNDSFRMGVSGSIAQIDGGAGTNTLTGRNAANEWDVSAINGGALYADNNADGFGMAYVTAFTNIQNLTGGNNNDTFTIVSTSRVGMIDGGGVGNGGADEIRGPVSTGPVIWVLGSTNSTVDNGSPINFTNIQMLTGANDTSDTFNFTVTPASTGVTTIDGGSNSDTTTTDTVSIASVASGALLNVGAYQEIETYIGNAGSTLEGGTSSIWTIEDIGGTTPGINDGTINTNTNFYDFGTVLGGSGTDTFTFVDAATMASINGAAGANSITGPDGTTTLTLATATNTTLNIDDGTTPASTTILDNIQTLNGGTGADTFVVNTTAAASGVTAINGGTGNDIFVFSDALPVTTGITVSGQADTDTLDLSGNGGIISVALNQYNVERIIGNNNNSTFTGLAGTNTWSITPVAVSAGSITFTDGQNDGTIINENASQTFIGFNNLTGGNGSDIFTIEANGNLSGLLSGGGGTGNTLTILNTSIANVETETGTAGAVSNLNVTGINNIMGNSVTALISDSSIAGDWTITGINAGILNGMTFSNFASLQGGSNADTFRLHTSIDFAGSIEGGITGIDEIIAGNRETNNWVITASNNTGTVTGITGNFSGIETLTGGNQTDNFTLSNAVNFNGSMNGGDGTDQLTGGNGVNIWTINGNNAGSVTGLSNGFSTMETLVGGSQQDTFNLSDVMTFNGTLSGGTQNNDQNDRLVAGDRENDWAVTGANNTGTVTGLAGAFTAIEFLNGNNQRDTLTLSNTGTFSGSFDGGGGINDAVIGGNTTNNWTITAADNTGTVTGLSGTFSRVEALTGTSAQDTFTLLADTDFNGSINGGAGSTTDTLIGGATGNTWEIDGTNGNTVTGLGAGNTFSNIQNLSGATGEFDDTFIFRNAGSIAGSINGGGQAIRDIVDMSALNSAITVRLGVGQDVTNVERVIGNNNGTSSEADPFDSTLVAENNRNTWAIDGINRGTVDDVEFIDFNNLQGGTAADTFVISDGGDITGLIDGGSPNRAPWTPGTATPAPVVEGILQTEDILDYSALASVDIIDTDFSNIELVKGNANGTGTDDSTLRAGATGNSNWLILSAGTGVVNSTQFVGFNNIVGGNGDDTFVIEGDFGGSIRGGGGGGTDTVNYQALDTFRVVFGGKLGITGIERVEGDGSGFTIVGRAGFDNTWTINGNNQGAVTAGSETLAFIGFDNIEGNNESAYTDTFTVQGGNIDSSVLGMAGDDTLIVELTGSETGQLFFNGGAGTNTVLLQDGATIAAYRGEYTTGIAGGYDQLQYTNIIAGTPKTFTLNYQQAGQVQDTVSADSLIVNGTPGADMIELGFDSAAGMNTFGVSSATSIVHYSNKDDLTILGLGDVNDTVNITSASNLVGETGVLTINAETVTSTSTITANQFVLDSVITAGTVSAPININVTNLSLTDSANVASQALYLQAQNGLTLTQLGAVERVDIMVLDGNFMNSAALTTNSQLDISTLGTTGGNIVLTGDNQLSGAVTLNAANDIIFDGDNTFSGTTSFKADNNILLTGANMVSASISLDATRIDLLGDNRITAAIVLNGTTATINNTVATDLGDVIVQNLTVTSTGNITDSGVIDVQADGDGMGKATFTATNGNIVLDNVANNFDVINLTATNGAVTVNEADGISIATANMSGALNVTSNIGLAANEVSTDNNMALGNITAATIDLNANEGAIVNPPDNLPDNPSSNLTASMTTLAAASGIGDSRAININTSTLSVINASFEGADERLGEANVNVMTTSGAVSINNTNTGNVTINDLRNNGDITLTNAGNVTLSVTDSGGAIDANYGGNLSDSSYAGDVTLNAEGNSISTLGVGMRSGNADIIAESLDVTNVSRFGTQSSPIGLRVNDNFTLQAVTRQGQGEIYYLGPRPRIISIPEGLREQAIRGFIGISSQQLIDIESLGAIDSAIFTEVRNYNYDDISIRLPADQDYGDGKNEKENGEEKGS